MPHIRELKRHYVGSISITRAKQSFYVSCIRELEILCLLGQCVVWKEGQWTTKFLLLLSQVIMFHCIMQASRGGDSLYVDGFNVAEKLYQMDPKAFKLLTTSYIPHFFRDKLEYNPGRNISHAIKCPIKWVQPSNPDPYCSVWLPSVQSSHKVWNYRYFWITTISQLWRYKPKIE